jgi:hypothetical protein
MDKFMYISLSNASSGNECNEPERKRPVIMCRKCSDNYLPFGFCGMAVKHFRLLSILYVEKNSVKKPWFRAS